MHSTSPTFIQSLRNLRVCLLNIPYTTKPVPIFLDTLPNCCTLSLRPYGYIEHNSLYQNSSLVNNLEEIETLSLDLIPQ